MRDWRERIAENSWQKRSKRHRIKTLQGMRELYGEAAAEKPKAPGDGALRWGEPKGISEGLKKRREAQQHDFTQKGAFEFTD